MTLELRQDVAGAIARAIAARLREVLRAADRIDALDGRSGPLASEEVAGDPVVLEAALRELLARALRLVADARGEAILRALSGGDAVAVAALAARCNVPRLVAMRRIDDLVEAGLVRRELETDTVALAPLGAALVELVTDVVDQARAHTGTGQER